MLYFMNKMNMDMNKMGIAVSLEFEKKNCTEG